MACLSRRGDEIMWSLRTRIEKSYSNSKLKSRCNHKNTFSAENLWIELNVLIRQTGCITFFKVSSESIIFCWTFFFLVFFFLIPFWWLPLFSSLVYLIMWEFSKEKLEADQSWKWKKLEECLPLKPSLGARAVWGDEMWCGVMLSFVLWFLSVCQVKIHFLMHVQCTWWNTRHILTGHDPLIEKKMSFDDVFRKNKIEQPGGRVL